MKSKGLFLCFFLSIILPQVIWAADSLAIKINSLKSKVEKTEEGSILRADLFIKISATYYQNDSLIKAIVYQKKAAEIYLELNNQDKYCKALESLSDLYFFINDFKQSLKYCLDAIKILDKQNKKDAHYYGLIQNIGITYIGAEEDRKGIPFLINAMKYFEQDNTANKEYLIVNYIDIGGSYKNIGLIDSAFYYYHKALANAKKYNIKKHTGNILVNLGDLYKELNVYDKAESFFQQAIVEFNKNHDERGYWYAVYNQSIVENKLNNTKAAIDSLDKAVKYFKANNNLVFLRDSYQTLSEIYESKKDIANSLLYFKLCSAVKDTIFISDQKSHMTELQMQYELQKVEVENLNEIALMQKENQLKVYKIYILIGLLTIGLLLIILYVFRLRSRKKLSESKLKNSKLEQQQLEQNLTFKQKELENIALYIMQKNEFLEQIKSDVVELKKTSDTQNQSKIKLISIKITQSLRKNKDLEKLQNRIDQMHATFLIKLSNKYPDLTEKEKRLCVLLKLNFSSKEIASLHNISENAVMMARYRMRKKMDISTDENLVEFLQKMV
ncbi:MAG: tetratricopeptide repeat protein [Bacteroidetes bacterium]|nr:tetratricopeptide repeat protein [Bacteroidota bacterium]